jgi:CheY-like chemotaxis protein
VAQPLVLAIEPDLRQAAIVKRIVREKAFAEVAVVDSRDAAIEAMRTCMPDVLLLSALMSPRDEDELVAHLRTLENAGHLQTHTIPQLASALDPGEERSSRGLLSAFRRKKDPTPVAGCDPDLFAEEIRVFLQRAADKKSQLQNTDFAAPDMRPSAKVTQGVAETADEPAAGPSSSWASPFEWKPAGSTARSNRAREEASRPAPPAEAPLVVAAPEPAAPEAPLANK